MKRLALLILLLFPMAVDAATFGGAAPDNGVTGRQLVNESVALSWFTNGTGLSGLADSLYVYMRNDGDGDDNIILMVYDNNGTGGRAGTLLDSTVVFVCNSSATSPYIRFAAASAMSWTVAASDTVWIGAYSVSGTACHVARQDYHSPTSNDTTGTGTDPRPLNSTVVSLVYSMEAQLCVGVVFTPATSNPNIVRIGSRR